MSPNQAYSQPPMPTGAILAWGAPLLPAGYLWCDGTSYARTTYPVLADTLNPQIGTISGVNTSTEVITVAVGTTMITGDQMYFTGSLPTGLVANTLYFSSRVTNATFTANTARSTTGVSGTVNLSTTTTGGLVFRSPWGSTSSNFSVPDFRGKTLVAPDQIDGGTDAAILGTTTMNATGFTGGEEMHTLTTNEMPVHHHTIENHVGGPAGAGWNWAGDGSTLTATSGDTGGGVGHNNLQPYAFIPYIIKY